MGSIQITDEMKAAARAEIDRVRPARGHFTRVTADAVRHFALGVGDDNPLWTKGPRDGANQPSIAPPTFLWTAFMSPLFFPSESKASSTGGGLPGIQALFAGCQFRFHRPIQVGDKLRATSVRRGLLDPLERMAGDLTEPRVDLGHALAAMERYAPETASPRVFQIESHTCREDETGALIGDLIEIACRVEPEAVDPREGRYAGFRPRRYSPEEMAVISNHYLHEAAHRRGPTPRTWENVRVGDELPALVKGPLSILSYTAFFAGAPAFFNLTDRVLANFAVRFPESVKWDDVSGMWVLPEEMHWHPYMARQLGMPEGFDVGSQRVAWFAHLLTDWIGDHGWIDELDVWFHRPLFLTETAWIRGTVDALGTSTENEGQITIRMSATTFDGEELSIGRALVSLPRGATTSAVWLQRLAVNGAGPNSGESS